MDAAEYAFQMLAGEISAASSGLPLERRVPRTQHAPRAPAVIVSGKTASQVVEETFVPELAASGTVPHQRGGNWGNTPERDPAAREITSAFVIQTYGGALRTTAFCKTGKLPRDRRLTETGKIAEERYFAVFQEQKSSTSRQIAPLLPGGLGSLAGLLWPEEVVLDR